LPCESRSPPGIYPKPRVRGLGVFYKRLSGSCYSSFARRPYRANLCGLRPRDLICVYTHTQAGHRQAFIPNPESTDSGFYACWRSGDRTKTTPTEENWRIPVFSETYDCSSAWTMRTDSRCWRPGGLSNKLLEHPNETIDFADCHRLAEHSGRLRAAGGNGDGVRAGRRRRAAAGAAGGAGRHRDLPVLGQLVPVLPRADAASAEHRG